MWTVRVLSGPQRGQSYQLKDGRNVLGRASTCNIQIASQGVSKEHCEIVVSANGVKLADLNSSNGTFVNGVRVQKAQVKLGDKISLNDIMLDIVELASVAYLQPAVGYPQGAPMSFPQGGQVGYPQQHPGTMGYPQQAPVYPHVVGQGSQPGNESSGEQPGAFVIHHQGGLFERLWMQFKDYVETVALPGVYKLAEVADLKIVLMGLMGIFLLIVTLLAMIPMVTITRASILKESERRAQSLARTMADVTRASWGTSGPGAVSTSRIEVEEGVKKVMVINQADGSIIAPAAQAGTTPKSLSNLKI